MKTTRFRFPLSHVAKTQVYPFILSYQQEHFGLVPTLEEIGDKFKRSREWARLCLIKLEKEKMIAVTPRRRRGIVVRGDYKPYKKKKGKK